MELLARWEENITSRIKFVGENCMFVEPDEVSTPEMLKNVYKWLLTIISKLQRFKNGCKN